MQFHFAQRSDSILERLDEEEREREGEKEEKERAKLSGKTSAPLRRHNYQSLGMTERAIRHLLLRQSLPDGLVES